MKKLYLFPLIFFIFVVSLFSYQFVLKGRLPIPADTIVGLYYPFRDIYTATNPSGIAYKNSLITDPVKQQYPWRFLSITLEKQFQLPLWNPYNFAGTPLLANMQSAPIYPLNILLFILPFHLGWSILVLLQPLLAGIFLYLYLRKMNIAQSASFLSAVSFAFCGFNTVWLEWNTIGHVMLWLPLILLANEHLLKKVSWQWIITLIFAECSAIFAGHLQTLFYTFIVSNSYLIARIIQISIKAHSRQTYVLPAIKKYLPFLFIGAVIFGITAVQWIPTLQLISHSAREADQQNWHRPDWFIPETQLVQFIAPDFFGNPTTLNYWGVWNYAEFVGYVGIIPFIFALFALGYRHDKKTTFFGSIFFLSLVFALNTWPGQLPFILKIPFLSTSQPSRLLALTDFSLAILAGLGLDFFLKSQKKQQIRYPLFFTGMLFIALWIYVLVGYKIFGAVRIEDIITARHNLYFPTILFLIAAIAISGIVFNLSFPRLKIFLVKGRHHEVGSTRSETKGEIRTNNKQFNLETIITIILILVTLLDLLRFSWKFNSFSEKAYLYPITQSLAYLEKQPGIFRIMKTDDRILIPNFSLMYHLQSLDGYDPLYLLRYGELMAAVGRDKPDIHAPFGFNRTITPGNYESPIIDLLGAKYVLSLQALQSPKLQEVYMDGKTRIYKNTKAYPRAFFVNNVLPVTSKQVAINALFDNAIHLNETAVVENWRNSNTLFSQGKVTMVKYAENTVELTTQTNKNSFLVLTDSYYPTWHAKICPISNNICQDTEIYLTDYNFRGIVVPGGENRIIFYTTVL